jgi:RNA polymerase sigma-70 factor (ECF subfamily)
MTDGPPELIALFERHYAPIVRALRAAGHVDAEDAVQEAFVRALVHWRKVRGYDDPAAWVRRVAVNRCLNARRSRERQARLRDRIAVFPAAAGEPRQDAGSLADAIAALPARQRTALSLYYLGDLSVAQVADAMGLSRGAVKYHLHAAREALRAGRLEPDGR